MAGAQATVHWFAVMECFSMLHSMHSEGEMGEIQWAKGSQRKQVCKMEPAW